jgi:site-specific DNA-cytosine methylase
VDINKFAIHTYTANFREPKPTKLFYGSVDDLLKQALRGNPSNSGLIPLPGDVEVRYAGSPRQGSSKLNVVRNNDKGLENQSLLRPWQYMFTYTVRSMEFYKTSWLRHEMGAVATKTTCRSSLVRLWHGIPSPTVRFRYLELR